MGMDVTTRGTCCSASATGRKILVNAALLFVLPVVAVLSPPTEAGVPGAVAVADAVTDAPASAAAAEEDDDDAKFVAAEGTVTCKDSAPDAAVAAAVVAAAAADEDDIALLASLPELVAAPPELDALAKLIAVDEDVMAVPPTTVAAVAAVLAAVVVPVATAATLATAVPIALPTNRIPLAVPDRSRANPSPISRRPSVGSGKSRPSGPPPFISS